ncbi:FimV/HubP family polar landmark protein [Arhodomonas sp. SL1]|uniref:FimV/HubP family polar landmark protein n=1 Tax=Arhodomonas sp. SL1 TaxID=3425691 RepID=UPI003F88476D
MRRTIAIATLLTLAGAWTSLAAVGLGDLETESALNEPLEARIPVVSLGEVPLERVEVGLASPEQFERSGVPRPFYLTELEFSLAPGNGGRPFIHVSSDRPIQEPFLDFLVSMEWPQGSLVRQFTVLLDPPTYSDHETSPSDAGAVAAQGGETAADSPREGRDTPDSYGPVGAGDTLWEIAGTLRPPDATVHQTVMALLRDNPEAFLDGNVNGLRRGAVLEAPDTAAATRMSDAEAREAFAAQMEQWRNGQVAEGAADTGDAQGNAGGEGDTAQQTSEAAGQAGGELRVVTPELEPGGDTAGDLSAASLEATEENVERLQMALAASEEENASLRSENAELRDQLSGLRDRLEELERAIDLEVAAGLTMAADDGGADTTTDGAASEAGTEETGAAIEEAESAAGAGEAATSVAGRVGAILDSLLVTVRANRLPIAGAGGLALLLLLLLLVMRRRRLESEAAPVPANPAVEAQRSRRSSAGGRSDEVVEEEGDPAEQADFFLAYGRYERAQEVLDRALGEQPDNRRLRLKLLEVLARRGDRTGFESEAQVFHTQIESTDDVEWQRVVALGRDVAPGNPLFTAPASDAAGTPATGSDAEAATAGSIATAPVTDEGAQEEEKREPAGEFESLPDFEVTGRESGTPQAGASEPAEESEPEASPAGTGEAREEGPSATPPAGEGVEPLTDFDFELEPDEGQTRVAAAGGSAEVETEAASTEGFAPLEFDVGFEPEQGAEGEESTVPDMPGLDFDLPAPADTTGAEQPESAGTAMPPLEGATGAGGEWDEFDPDDAVATKLDLAQAYVDMGDPEGAHSLLEEVIEEGDDEQRRKAQNLRAQVG